MASKPPPSEQLAGWLPRQRWFRSKSRRIATVTVDDSIALDTGVLHVVRVTLDDGDVQRYAVPLVPGAAPADALDDPRFAREMLDLVRQEGRAMGRAGAVTGRRTRAFPGTLGPETVVRKIGGEQSNTSVVVGDLLIVKYFRRLAPGV